MATGSVTSGDVRLLVLRGAVGVVMVAHGYNHILGRWKDCGYQPLRHNCVCVVRRGELTWMPYFASKAVATKHLRCLPYEVCGGRRITYIECQVRSGCLVDSVCERRHREGASDWCEVARSACLSRSQGSLAALLDLAALSLDDATPYLAPPQLALRDLQLLDGAMATEFCGLRTHSLDTT
jgi:hypothetical protein